MRLLASSLLLLAFAPLTWGAVAKHTIVTLDSGGVPVEYIEMAADDNGNLRVETYSVAGNTGISTSFDRSDLDAMMVYQAKEARMLAFDGSRCHAMGVNDPIPGMPAGGMDQYAEQMQQAQAQMSEAFEQMAKENPEMAKMLQQQMGGGDIAAMIPKTPELAVTESGQDRRIDQYSTTEFVVTNAETGERQYAVWAADINDVEGADTINRATLNMMNTFKERMDSMGLGDVMAGAMNASIMDKMEDYYPIETQDNDGRSKLISTDGAGSTDFYPECNQ